MCLSQVISAASRDAVQGLGLAGNCRAAGVLTPQNLVCLLPPTNVWLRILANRDIMSSLGAQNRLALLPYQLEERKATCTLTIWSRSASVRASILDAYRSPDTPFSTLYNLASIRSTPHAILLERALVKGFNEVFIQSTHFFPS